MCIKAPELETLETHVDVSQPEAGGNELLSEAAGNDPQSRELGKDQRPGAPVDDPCFETTSIDPQPGTPGDNPQPETTSIDPQPGTPGDNPQPEATNIDPQPRAPGDDPHPKTIKDNSQIKYWITTIRRFLSDYKIQLILSLLFIAFVIIGLVVFYNDKPYLYICINDIELNVKIHVAYCASFAWASIVVSCLAATRFKRDSKSIDSECHKDIINDLDNAKIIHIICTAICAIVISFIAIVLVLRIHVSTTVKVYLVVLAICYIVTMTGAYGYAIYLVNKIHKIYSQESINYNHNYPISTRLFQNCYHIFSHGIVLFWIIGIFLLALITLLCINKDVINMETRVNLFVLIIAYVCILFGFGLSTIYPYYITSRKIEELKLMSISEYLTSDLDKEITDKSRIDLISNSPNKLRVSSGIRVYSTLTVIVSLISQICTLYLLLNGIYP